MSSPYNRKDHLYQLAKEEGYRSRAAYKLLELQKSYKLMKPGDRVLDVGAWPGGWMQASLELIGASGQVVGIDLQELDSLNDPRAVSYKGDARDLETFLGPDDAGFDVVISDMSPKLSGIREADQAGTVACAELALFIATNHLKQGGNFAVKVFKGGSVEGFVKSCRPMFNKVIRTELKSSRTTSNEFYVVGLGFTSKR